MRVFVVPLLSYCSGEEKKKKKEDKVTQRDGMKRLFEVIWKCQVTSAAGTNTNVFSPPPYLNPSSVSRCRGKRGRGDGESEPRYGAVARAPAGTAGVIACYCRCAGERGGARIDLTLISGGDRNSAG